MLPKIEKQLLEDISKFLLEKNEESIYELPFGNAGLEYSFIKLALKAGIKAKLSDKKDNGIFPIVEIRCVGDTSKVASFLKKHYDSEIVIDDYKLD